MAKRMKMFKKSLKLERKAVNMRLIEKILEKENIKSAIHRVKANKGTFGIDKMSVNELEDHFNKHYDEIKASILDGTYKPLPVRRVYIPKPNGKKRPLGIPVVIDRVIQQAIANILNDIFDSTFSDYSFGFRPNKSAHDAIYQVLEYLNDGYEWVIDMDIEKFFDRVNHDKLISILREKVNEKEVLHLIRQYLKAGVLEDGKLIDSEMGVPQGGPLSPLLANIYLDKFDKELEARGLHFVRYADDCNIFLKSSKAANRVMTSISSWLKRKLYLDVNMIKTKVVRPSNSNFLGFNFYKFKDGWKAKPSDNSKRRLITKLKTLLIRKRAIAIPTKILFIKLDQILRGWINYYRIGSMKMYLEKLGQWLRHKVRVIIIKKWKKPKRIFINLKRLNDIQRFNFKDEDFYKVANSRFGLYRQAGMYVVNYIISPAILSLKGKDMPGLIDPLKYYLKSL